MSGYSGTQSSYLKKGKCGRQNVEAWSKTQIKRWREEKLKVTKTTERKQYGRIESEEIKKEEESRSEGWGDIGGREGT